MFKILLLDSVLELPLQKYFNIMHFCEQCCSYFQSLYLA